MRRHLRTIIAIPALGIFLAACGIIGGPSSNPARDLAGTIRNWQGGAATLQAIVTDDDLVLVGEIGAEAAISADGRFELTLPAVPNAAALSDSGIAEICPGEFDGTVEPDTWREAFAEFAVIRDGERVGFVSLASSAAAAAFEVVAGDLVVGSLYVGEDVAIEGTCSYDLGTIEIDLALERGWNLVAFEILEVDETTGFPTRVRVESPEAVPAGTSWYLVAEPAAEASSRW